MTLSIHKLTAGSGYDYLTRQVAAADVTGRGHGSLADYYTAQGETPGVWIGSGLAGLDGLDVGDEVTAGQMRYLFGAGMHPLTDEMIAAAQAAGTEGEGLDRVGWLGSRYRVYREDVPTFQARVARRVMELNVAAGRDAHARVSLEEQASARTDVGRELFTAQYGRDPVDAREMASVIARHSRPRTRAVAGYDLTFSPVKSVSALWAVADQPTARVIEQAHQDAVRDALTYLEKNAVFTREGDGGIRQVDTRGLVAAAFTHRDSRAGDPDLHTHVAVANKVQTRDGGRWLAIDGRLIFTANVAASEVYNTRLEHHLTTRLGVRFAPRPGTDPRKRPIREIVGVEVALLQRWSTRRASIQARRTVLSAAFQGAHGRPPTPIEAIALAQQATLETREAKHEPRSLAQQRTTWAAQAAQTLGGQDAVAAMVDAVLHPSGQLPVRVDAAWIAATATAIAATVQSSRAHWQRWHVEAEALRRVRGVDLAGDDIDRVVDLLVDQTLTAHSLPLTHVGDGIDVPDVLRRASGDSVYVVARSQRFTSEAVLAAEARIVARAGQHDGARVGDGAIEAAITASAAAGVPLNPGQASLVRDMATSRARVQLAIAPAGAGKTTAMAALADAWTSGGGTIIGLAPSAAAADVLKTSTGATTDTLAKLAWHLNHPGQGAAPAWAQNINVGTLVVIDEAGMADTLTLDTVIEHVTARGASVRLVGDDQQLAAVGAGGVLRDITATHGALHLSELMRFTTPAEAAASLALRDGLPEAIGFYLDQHRVHVGDLTTLTDEVFSAWSADRAAGTDSLMLAPTRDLTRDLNHRARTHRLTLNPALPDGPSVTLADGNTASLGEIVITRSNDRRLRLGTTDWVKNGDRWQVNAVRDDGSLIVRHVKNRLRAVLPAAYVATSVELGYASTIHTAQGVTADVSHTLVTGQESRQVLYTAATRGKHTNHLYVRVVGEGDEHAVTRPETRHQPTASDVLETILDRDGSARSATTMRQQDDAPDQRMSRALATYLDSLDVARRTCPTFESDPADAFRAQAVRAPLPWLPGIPGNLAEHPEWGRYLIDRAAAIRYLSAEVIDQARAAAHLPPWARQLHLRRDDDLYLDLALFRAASGVPDTDLRPTGVAHPDPATRHWQDRLGARLLTSHSPDVALWRERITGAITHAGSDPFTPVLAERLATLTRTGVDTSGLVQQALAGGDLPDEHQAAALWWRISSTLTTEQHANAIDPGADPRSTGERAGATPGRATHEVTDPWELEQKTAAAATSTRRAPETRPIPGAPVPGRAGPAR